MPLLDECVAWSFVTSAKPSQDFKDMWRRYDQDDNGYLDMDELHILLEDLLERQCGHRNLSDAPWTSLFIKKPLAACRKTVVKKGRYLNFTILQLL